jgi:hypothetical protein
MEDGPRDLLARALSAETPLVIELGSWLGLSTRYIADRAPNAVVVAVDHWRGSPEHHRHPEWRAMLPRLYETFLALCWEYRGRIVPLRMTTLEGLRTVAEFGLEPALIYVDAEHSAEAVTAEVELARRLFPRAVLVGDDYDWPGIAPAVCDAARRHGLALETLGTRWRGWKLAPPRPGAEPLARPGLPPSLPIDRPGPPSPPAIDLAPTPGGFVDCDAVRAEPHEPRFLTALDPTPESGLYPLARIADELGRRRPDIPILIVEGRSTAAALLACGVDPTTHRNLHTLPRQADPRRHWGLTRMALLPWLAPELSPAPALEALANGIPVVGSDRPALVEALGRAGVILPLPARLTPAGHVLPTAGEVAPWIDAILRIWDDAGAYSEQRALALAEVGRRALAADGVRRLPCPPAPPSARGRAVVLVPFRDRIEPECDRALGQLEVAGVRVVRKAGCSAIDLARSELASDALHDAAESILFVDADIGFDPADALRLLARPEPVVAGVYAKKNVRDVSSSFAEGVADVVFGVAAPGPYPLKYAAAGFLRVRADVLRRMVVELALPLCNRRWGRGVWPFFLPAIVEADDPEGPHYLAEDWAFSHRLRQIRITPLADTSLRLWHLGGYAFGWEDAGSDRGRYRSYHYQIV